MTSRSARLIPTFDLRAFDADGGEGVARELDAACRDIGFFLVRGHGVPEPLMDGVRAAARAFFDLPYDEKAACRSSFLGYRAVNTLRASTRNAAAPLDAKETFTIGRELAPREAASEFLAPNAWPAALAGFEDCLSAYYEVMADLAGRVARAFAAALEIPPDFFAARARQQTSWVTLINYPARAAVAGSGQRFGEHRDRGCFTILWSSGPGLEVRDELGCWHPVPTAPDGFIVNVGSMLASWTGRRWVSPMHRVVDAAERRQSIVFFFNPDHDVALDPLPTEGAGRWPVSTGPSLTVGDYLRSMLALYR